MVRPSDRRAPLKAFRDRATGKADPQAVAAGIVALEAEHAAARGMSKRRQAQP